MSTPADPLDEILWIDKERNARGGIRRLRRIITFGDGTKLTITAAAKEPPAQELTTETEGDVTWFDPVTGRGATDARELAQQSTAYRVAQKIMEQVSNEIPQRLKVECPLCGGGGLCAFCLGMGCEKCRDTGNCPTCKGRGEVLEG